MASPARPEQRHDDKIQQSSDERPQASQEPIYLRHRYHGELGHLLREYYAGIVDQPLPDRLLRLVEKFRQEEQSK